MPTITINNFGGRLTRVVNGNINSGLAKYSTTHSVDSISNPNQLSWEENPIRIDSTGTSSITGLIMAGKQRIESDLSYMYAIDHNAKLYKIQSNSASNPNVDSASVIGTLTSQSPTFTRGGWIDFFGTTEQIYVGHDKGVTRVNFDGSGEAFIGSTSSIVSSVPRPLKQFLGNLYFGNGNNIGEISSAGVLTNYNKLSPALADNTQVRDLDLVPDGSYMEIVITEAELGDVTSTSPDTGEISYSNSYVAKWNGVDNASTAIYNFKGYTLTSNHIFGSRDFKFGYDLAGAGVFRTAEKVISPTFARSPMPNAAGSAGNLLGWVTPEVAGGFSKSSVFLYGPYDQEFGQSDWFRPLQFAASGDETDIIRVPLAEIVSNLSLGATSNGYTGGVYGNGKMYFSTLENATGSPATAKYKFYKWFLVPTGTGTAASGVYETQTQLFSEQISVKEVRIYTEPLVANNEFDIDLIGSDGNSISNSNITFSVGTNVTAGDDITRYTPDIKPTYALGLRITNSGSVNMVFNKIEIDYEFVES